MNKLQEKYRKEVVPQMMANFGYKNPMAVPKIEKVVVNTGFGRQVVAKTGDEQKKFMAAIIEDLSAICGQRAVLTSAKKAIASFKIRKGIAIGAMTVLRGKKMYDFLERVINIALPRSRDFRGIDPKSFDRSGNLAIAVKEHTVFPEIMPEKVKTIFGLEIIVATTAESKEEGLNLLKAMGFPIK